MVNNYMLPEYRIRKNIKRPNISSYERFANYPTAVVADVFNKRQILPPKVKPVWNPVSRVAGSVITVKATLGDQLLPLKAIEMALPGDIIVITGDYKPANSVWGGVMSTMAKEKGVKSLITDSMIRDLQECRDLEFPIWATGVTPIGPRSLTPPGELNLTITIGNAIINPGDLIVADEDGVAVIPKNNIHETEKAIIKKIRKEEEQVKDINLTEKKIIKEDVDIILSKQNVEYLE